MNLSLKNSAFRGFYRLFAGAGIQAVSSILILAILARLLDPHSFGEFGAAMLAIGFCQLLSRFGMGTAIVHRPIITPGILATATFITLTIASVITINVFFAADMLAKLMGSPESSLLIKYMSVTCLMIAAAEIPLAVLQREYEYTRISKIRLYSYLVGYGATSIAMAVNGWESLSLVAAVFAQLGIQLFMLKKEIKQCAASRIQLKDLQSSLRYSLGMTCATITNYIAVQGDNFIISRMLGATSLGIYGRAYSTLMAPVGLIGSALDTTVFPKLSRMNENSRLQHQTVFELNCVIILLMLPITTLMYFNANEIIHFILGPNWKQVVPVFQILSISLVFRTGYKLYDAQARAAGQVGQRVYRQCLYAAFIYIGSYFGSFYGLIGVSYAVTLAIIVNYISMCQLVFKNTEYGLKKIFRMHVAIITINIPTMYLTYYLHHKLIIMKLAPIAIIMVSTIVIIINTIILYYIIRSWLPSNVRLEFYKIFSGKLIHEV